MSQAIKKASADFLLVTANRAECSYWVDQEEGQASVESDTSWYPEEDSSPTSEVYVTTEAEGRELFSRVLTGDDWRHLESSGLLESFTAQILAGADPDVVMTAMRNLG